MNETPIEIHPYDFAELIQPTLSKKQIDSFKTVGDNLFEFDDKLYHRTVAASRTPGPHFIE